MRTGNADCLQCVSCRSGTVLSPHLAQTAFTTRVVNTIWVFSLSHKPHRTLKPHPEPAVTLPRGASQPKSYHDPQDRHYKKIGDDVSAEDMAMYKEAFELFDTDGTGTIDGRELKFCCKVCALPIHTLKTPTLIDVTLGTFFAGARHGGGARGGPPDAG